MIRVKIDDLHEGLIVAEPVLDFSGKVLLAAKSTLTEKHIEILKTWDIDFVRIREEKDTDEKLTLALKLDREQEEQVTEQRLKADDVVPQATKIPVIPVVKKNLGINEETISLILKGRTSQQQPNTFIATESGNPLGSLVTEESLCSYQDYLSLVTNLVEKNFKVKDVALKEVNKIAKDLTSYIVTTPGVIGYVLQTADDNCNKLARHILGTSIVAGKIALLLEFPSKDVNNIVLGSLLHDIGKIHLPEEVANKARRLSPEEQQAYQSHVLIGMGMVKERSWIPKEVLLLIAQHHERIDGKGFPMGFKGNRIHPYAKIAAIADYFDQVTHPASKPAPNLINLANELLMMGDKFELAICEIFREYLNDFLLSNKVRLDDGRMAEIIYMHQSFSEPVIRTSDGQFIDLNKSKVSMIKSFMI